MTATTKANKGQWTRQEWNNPEKRSVVDYILTTKCITNNTITIVIYEEEAFKIKTKDGPPTDHNTIIMNVKINNPRRKTYTERWKIINKEGWEKFNTEIQRANQTNQLAKKKYEEIEKIITQILKVSIGIQRYRETEEANIRNYKMHEEAKKESKRRLHRSMQKWERRTKNHNTRQIHQKPKTLQGCNRGRGKEENKCENIKYH